MNLGCIFNYLQYTYAYVCWLVGWYIWNSFSLFIFWENLHVYVCWKQLHWTCTFANETRFDFNSCMNLCMYVDLFYVRHNTQTQKSLPKERYNFLNCNGGQRHHSRFLLRFLPSQFKRNSGKPRLANLLKQKCVFHHQDDGSFQQISFKKFYNGNSHCSRWENT